MTMVERLQALRDYFNTGITKTYSFRIEQLKKLKSSILAHEEDIYAALYTDLKKSKEEAWVTEIGLVISEINYAIKNLRAWMQPAHATTNLLNLPSSSRVVSEPLGVVLIIGVWNYPFQLLMTPLAGAISAGNCVAVKTSEYAPATSAVMLQIIKEIYEPNYVFATEGDGATIVPEMMNHFTFDHVFFTGGTAVGKIIYKMAAERLVPVTLELGGKSPCVVESDANIKVAARRIAITKFSNAGQMCVAPDYVLVHESKKDVLIDELIKTIPAFYGRQPEDDYNYGKIINERQFNRITGYMKDGKIIYGGRSIKEKLFIEPTVLTDVSPEATIMKEEIFGPLLPILSFEKKEEATAIIVNNPNPLAFYVFTQSKKKEDDWINSIAFGGGCVNNTSWHFTNHHLPLGGRGASGIGSYHGKNSFLRFSHQKAVMKTPAWFDPDIKYPSFKGKLKLFKWIIK